MPESDKCKNAACCEKDALRDEIIQLHNENARLTGDMRALKLACVELRREVARTMSPHYRAQMLKLADELEADTKTGEMKRSIERIDTIQTKRQFVAYFFFVGWDCVSIGAHVCVTKPNVEIHLPFGFIRIGWCIVGRKPFNHAQISRKVFGIGEKY